MHTQTEASTPPEYANTTFSARPIDLSPWKTTEELLYLVEQSVFCHYEQTLKKEEMVSHLRESSPSEAAQWLRERIAIQGTTPVVGCAWFLGNPSASGMAGDDQKRQTGALVRTEGSYVEGMPSSFAHD